MTGKAQTAIDKLEQTPRRKMALRIWLRLLASSQLIEKQVRSRFRTEFDTTLPRFDVMAALAFLHGAGRLAATALMQRWDAL